MEARCGSCNKLFRVSDDKITGSGVKFPCTGCGDTVKITRENFEQYKLSQDAVAALSSYAPKPPKATAPAEANVSMPEAANDASVFDLSDPATAAASLSTQSADQIPSLFAETATPFESAPEPEPSPFDMEFLKTDSEPEKPAVESQNTATPPVKPEQAQTAPVPEPKPKPAPAPKAEVKAAVQPPKPEPLRPSVPPAPKPPREVPQEPAPVVASPPAEEPPGSSVPTSSGSGKKIAVLIILVLLLGTAGFGVTLYLKKPSQTAATEAVKQLTLPDGLQIQNASGMIDPEKGDLIITGVVENTTDNAKPAWYIIVDVYDAQGAVLTRGKFLSGKQLYTRRDFEILTKRGVNIQDLVMKNLQEQGIIIPPKSSANFTVTIIEPPIGVASFNATLQPFDPVQLFKEMAEEQKQ